jgi:hypothetical protein
MRWRTVGVGVARFQRHLRFRMQEQRPLLRGRQALLAGFGACDVAGVCPVSEFVANTCIRVENICWDAAPGQTIDAGGTTLDAADNSDAAASTDAPPLGPDAHSCATTDWVVSPIDDSAPSVGGGRLGLAIALMSVETEETLATH